CEDICDELVGVYPKTFKFVGWHPFCRCIVVPKLADEDEFIARQQALIDGEEVPEGGYSGEVTEYPEGFTSWVNDNAERIENATSEPYFIRDNKKIVNNILGMSDNPTFATKVTVGDKEYLLKDLIAECRIEPTENGKIYVHPNHGKNELAENLDFARWRSEMFGEEVILLPNPEGVKSPDSYNITRGVNEEYKISRTPTKNSIDSLLRDGAKQADIIILEPQKMDVHELSNAIHSRTRRTGINELRIKIGSYEAVYSREQICTPGFKIKPEDFLNESAFRSWGQPLNERPADAKLRQFFGLNKKTPQEIAAERHAVRDAAAIQQRWNERRIANIRKAIADGQLPEGCDKGLAELSPEQFNARIESLQKTAKRHAARTQRQEDNIRLAWQERMERMEDESKPTNVSFIPAKTIDNAKEIASSLGIKKVNFGDAAIDEINLALEVLHKASSQMDFELDYFFLGQDIHKQSKSFTKPVGGFYNADRNTMAIDLTTFRKSNFTPIVSYKDKIVSLRNNIASLERQIEQSEARLGRSKAMDKMMKADIRMFRSRIADVEIKINQFEKLIASGNDALPFTVAASFEDVKKQVQAEIWHEIGHYVDHKTGQLRFKEGNFISEYCKDMRGEEFAEWFSYYKMNGEKGVPADLLKIFKSIERKH
ncbi:MAG: hypothetical protein K2G35_08590, partial [Duncaniella sp.]|nr:hypothetical protein [Duncaniella sp.]